MSFFETVRAAAEQAAVKAKEGVEDLQAKRELGQAYGELGRVAFELIEGGEISDARLEAAAGKVRSLLEARTAGGAASEAGAAAAAETDEASEPPATSTS